MASESGLGRPFWHLAASSGTSNLADGIFKLGLPLAAIAVTRSPAVVAGLELVRSLPWLLFALPVGALADRLDRRRMMMAANSVRAMSVAVLALLVHRGDESIEILYLVAVSSGIAEVFSDTASQSILPSVVDHGRLARANGRLGAIELGTQQFLGPPIAGLLVAVSVAAAFWTTTALWVVAIVVLSMLRGEFRPERSAERTSIRSDISEGCRFLLSRPPLRTMAAMVGVANLASSATGAVLVLHAVGADSTLQLTEAEFGFLFLTTAAGSIAITAVNERIERRLGRGRTLTLSVCGMVVFIVTPALTDDIVLIASAFFAGGALIMVWNIITVSFRQAVTPDHLLGRLNSVYRLLAWGTMPIGAALGGLIAEAFGLRVVFASMGVLTALLFIPDRALTDAALDAAERDAHARAPSSTR